MEMQEVDFIGGSTRFQNDHWNLNCYQMLHENYELKLIEGYHQSTKESCLICDFVHGPILARTKLFKELKFEPNFNDEKALILDLFWKMKFKFGFHLLNCPDVMTNIRSYDRISQSSFLPFAKKYQVYDLHLWNDYRFRFKRSQLELPCHKSSGIALSPACTEVKNSQIVIVRVDSSRKNK